MDNIEVPEYFICPISLEIMKDPVTAISGITYDRENIEHWLWKEHNMICPVSKQHLPQDSDLTPNHTLRRLIQAWCTMNAPYGIDRIPTPKPPLTKLYVINIMRNLGFPEALRKLEVLAMENDRNQVYMVEAGLVKELTSFIVSCYRKGETSVGLQEALSLFYLVRKALVNPTHQPSIPEKDDIIDSLIWVFGVTNEIVVKTHAAYAIKSVLQVNPGLMERLKPEFFKVILSNLSDVSQLGILTDTLLRILLDASSSGRNRVKMVEFGSVHELIEVELTSPENKTTELVLGILYQLCNCADGRAQLLAHAAGIAVITRRILKVSATADDLAVLILWQICKYSATNGVLLEMLRVGAVSKLCIVIQAGCASHLKEKAREILRMHFDVWKDSPCIEVPTLTMYTR